MHWLQLGHHDALAVLFDRYQRLVMNIALRILRDPGEAEDLLQACSLKSSALRHNLILPKALLKCGSYSTSITGASIADTT